MKNFKLTEEKKAIAKKYFEQFYNANSSEKALELVNELVSTDFVDFAPIPGSPENKEGFKTTISLINSAFSQKYAITHLFSEGNTHTGIWKASATHVGDFMGIPATNKTFDVEGITIYEVEDGKIIKHWEKFDLHKIMHEITAE